eukprot:gnl/Hemi2/15891_TR5251_c0_g1_i1.p2 gnl/Hemi2/15891_TR5251_c0_g1~~gnl/Hemi2/15891_TR5251_c0_g1_i1.p2  ORF type:complete len:446 (-),score=122.24 gnl/Hemi2/15891_TR5251_c0_g1_i1:1365-2702(-)
MDISDLYRQSGSLCKWSPDGKYLANAADFRLLLRDVETLQIVQLYTCLDAIQQVEWTSDSKYVLCSMFKRGIVQVWSLENADWTCKIDEGSAGLVSARWSPDGRHILSTSDFQLRVTIWSLVNRSVSCIRFPKFADKGLRFSHDGKYMALAERRDCKDFMGIYVCESWQMVKNFPVETSDLTDLSWSPDDRFIAVWDTPLVYKLLIYTPDGNCRHRFSAYDNALAIKTAVWSPSSHFLAVGSYDQKVRILNHQTWKSFAEYPHNAATRLPNVVVYREQRVDEDVPLPVAAQLEGTVKTRYMLDETPVSVRVVRPDPEKPNPKLGVGLAEWSADTRYLLTRNDNMPDALWLWDTHKLALGTLIIQLGPIKAAKWDPVHTRLAICTGSGKVYFWSEGGCSCVDVIPSSVPTNFKVSGLEWNPDGNSLVLLDRDRFCCCYPTWAAAAP